VIRFWSEVERTVAQINHYSKKDGEQYRVLVSQVCDLWNVITPYMQDHPTRPAPKTLAKLAWRAAKVRKSLAPAARLMLGSAESVLNEYFERDEVRDSLASWAGVGQAPLEEQGGAGVFAVLMITHRWGCKRPVGGMGAFSQALAAEVRARGGEIRVSSPVAEVICEGGRAVGVALRDGTEIRGRHVIGAVDPITLFSKLVDPNELPERTHRELRGLASLRHNVTLFKGDVAVRERVRLSHQGDDGDLLKSGYLLLCPDRGHVRQAVLASMQGELTAEPPMWLAVPSAFDRSLVPPGSNGDSLWVYSMAVPYELSNGRSWADEKTNYLRQCVSVIDSYAPGVAANVIGSYAQSPLEMSIKAHKGNVEHVDATLTQLGPWRPTPSLGGYKSPIDGLWHTGAGSHPMPAINGWSGRTTARFVYKAIRKQDQPRHGRLSPRAW
jgi:beta-carotene ketolase (CrtO type)